VRVVMLEHLADDRGTLLIAGPRGHSLVLHRVEDAAMDGLEAIANVRQRPAHDDAHRIVHVARTHLVLELQRQDGTDVEWFHLDLYADGDGSNYCQNV